MSFLKSIVKTAGKGVKFVTVAPIKVVAKGGAKVTKAVAKGVRKVPIVGKPLSSVVNLSVGAPFQLANSIASGQRIDKAVLNNLKQQVRDVKTTAPYAQMVLSLVPGIGTGISAGLGAGLALADGQPITAALKAGVIGAIPGGVAIQTAASLSASIAAGGTVSATAVNTVQLPAATKTALQTVLNGARDTLAKKKINANAIAAAEAKLPADVRKAINIGLALGQGEKLQKEALKNLTPAKLKILQTRGEALIKVNPVLQGGLKSLSTAEEKSGFAIGVLISNFKVTPLEAAAVRNKLSPSQKKGFDLALAGHIGSVSVKSVPKAVSNNASATFAFQATLGAQVIPPANQNKLVTTLAKSPATRNGVTIASSSSPAVKSAVVVQSSSSVQVSDKGFWAWVKKILGIK